MELFNGELDGPDPGEGPVLAHKHKQIKTWHSNRPYKHHQSTVCHHPTMRRRVAVDTVVCHQVRGPVVKVPAAKRGEHRGTASRIDCVCGEEKRYDSARRVDGVVKTCCACTHLER